MSRSSLSLSPFAHFLIENKNFQHIYTNENNITEAKNEQEVAMWNQGENWKPVCHQQLRGTKQKIEKKLLCTKKESDFRPNKLPQSLNLLAADIVRLVAAFARLRGALLLLYRKLVRPPPAIIVAKGIVLRSLAASIFRWPEVNVGAEKAQAYRWHIIAGCAASSVACWCCYFLYVHMYFLFKVNWLLLLRQPSLHTRFRSHKLKCATVVAIGIIGSHFCCCIRDVIKTFTLFLFYALFVHPIILKSHFQIIFLTLFCVCWHFFVCRPLNWSLHLSRLM